LAQQTACRGMGIRIGSRLYSGMSPQRLQQAVDELRDELAALGDEHVELREHLTAVIGELEGQLDDTTDQIADVPGLRERVHRATERFEAEHPDAVALLNHVVLTLTRMGI
jgi:ABC-type transporter Mla subunit MlaD